MNLSKSQSIILIIGLIALSMALLLTKYAGDTGEMWESEDNGRPMDNSKANTPQTDPASGVVKGNSANVDEIPDDY